MDVSNGFLQKAVAAVERGDLDVADSYTAMAHVAMLGHMSDKLSGLTSKVDRVADVLNAGKSWR